MHAIVMTIFIVIIIIFINSVFTISNFNYFILGYLFEINSCLLIFSK